MKILYFASLREQIGIAQEEILNIITIDELKKFLDKKYPQIFNENIVIALNMEVIKDNIVLQESDEIAFYPPVTGG